MSHAGHLYIGFMWGGVYWGLPFAAVQTPF
jgi:hypothetical protein